jgi:transcriptional regulator with XRE-family HTH domain
MNNKKIGQYLRSKRAERNLTQAELAKEFGVTYQAVSRWENGDSIPDIETLVMIADFYNITLDDIIQRDRQDVSTDTHSNPVPNDFGFMIVFGYLIFQILGLTSLWFASSSNLVLWDVIGLISFVMFFAVSIIALYLYYTMLSQRSDFGKKRVEFALRGTNIVLIFAVIVLYNRMYRYLRALGYTDFVIFIAQALIITLLPLLLYFLIQYLIYRIRYLNHFDRFIQFLFPAKRKVIKLLLMVFILLLLPTIIIQITPSFTILLILFLALL